MIGDKYGALCRHAPDEDPNKEECSVGHADGKPCFRCRYCGRWIRPEDEHRPDKA